MAIGSGGGRYWVAGTSAKCSGILVRSLRVSEGELSRGPSRCAPASKVAPGGVAIDVSDQTIWIGAGENVKDLHRWGSHLDLKGPVDGRKYA